jgi:hypothetical protein
MTFDLWKTDMGPLGDEREPPTDEEQAAEAREE